MSSVASPEPQLITTHSDCNEPTIPYGYSRQHPAVPPSLNDLKLPGNPFTILATMEVVHPTAATHDDNYSPQLLEPLDPSSISTSTPPMILCTIEGWETPHTTTDDKTFIQTRSQRGSISNHQARLLHRQPTNWKERWALKCPFQNEGECRSRCAKPMDRHFSQGRTFPDPLQKRINFSNTKLYILFTN